MKSVTRLTTAFVLLCLVGVGSAMADRDGHRGHGQEGHRHGHARILVAPYWGLWYGPPAPYYYRPYYPRVFVEPASPPVYIEQPPPSSGPVPAPETHYWYYCAASAGYYPYVQECPAGWQKVLPQPPGQPR